MNGTVKDRPLDSAYIDPYYLKNDSSGFKRFHFSEVPHYLQGNPFIHRGYFSQLSYKKCIQSTFLWSNETVNVWSHLIGFLIFLALMIYDNLVTIPKLNGVLNDHLIYTLYLSCFQVCMLCSAGFHLFRVHSEEVSKRWLSLDLAGISVGMLGCYLPSVYYGFLCFPFWKNIHMVIVMLLLIMTLIVQLHRRFLTSAWATRRLLLFVVSVAYGVGPSVHWIFLYGGFKEEIVLVFIPKLVLMYSLAILALFFYASQFPERCFPGKVDYIGSSHQWWHIIIVTVFLWWHQVGIDLAEYRTNYPCPSDNRDPSSS
ncbi:progestin and adipoQ receptor family member 3-like [Acanthaster planci]|uniref:Progestin and adipoQ receptor family member 3-like n=1 Tax=Acanthaster planci TaxID=133434 RepID=A0A8B7XZZ0_ACAPL|nr:progestin and adipoQ receptor family member 3-like [Acanthaster planci]XP_022085915.1 progestin and adipoQ receptor family member 3-like [Acanthaster planci]